jgi:hypothetical protein
MVSANHACHMMATIPSDSFNDAVLPLLFDVSKILFCYNIVYSKMVSS